MSRFVLALGLAAMLAVPALAADPPAPTAKTDKKAQAAAKAKPKEGERQRCEYVSTVGSNRQTKVCKTVQQSAQDRADAKGFTDRLGDTAVGPGSAIQLPQ